MAGFDIRNDTIWPLEISLGMLSPLYWGLTEPAQTFSRSTGAVWFTIQATVALDHKEHITTAGAVFDVFKNILFPQVMLGNWLINGEMLAGSHGITEHVAQPLGAKRPITIKGRPLDEMSTEDAIAGLQGIFTHDRSRVSKAGCYAGWSGHKQYVVSGGPTLQVRAGGVELVSGTPLSIVKL